MTSLIDFFAGADVIHTYSRAQALEDGVLVDLSAACPDVCGQHFKYPIACTAAVWHIIEAAIAAEEGDLNGIVHDILTLASIAGKAQGGDTIRFRVLVGHRLRAFKMVCGPGDDPAPVLTLMLPDES